jgi:hypothetical protein
MASGGRRGQRYVWSRDNIGVPTALHAEQATPRCLVSEATFARLQLRTSTQVLSFISFGGH